jgi:hypothetical protein
MTACTIGAATPASTGPGAAAPNSRPDDAGWAMVPHTLASDARLTAVDIRVVLALLYFARSKDICTPCDASIGARAGDISAGTVQRSLRRLEACGYIRREAVEPSDENRTGRVIRLLWRTPAPRASRGPTGHERPSGHRRATPRSPARDKEDVVVEAEISRSETSPALRPRQAEPTAPPVTIPGVQPVPTTTTALPFDLRAIGAAPELRPEPTRSSPPRQRIGLSLEELAKVAADTADPILAAEIARRTAPPPPPEPPPAMVPTPQLLESLPGRHDLIMVATRRLCEETGDFNVATQRTFEQMAMAVATRAVPAAVLIDCWRQGTGPRAEHRGKVLVAAWGREVRDHITPMRR